MTTASELHALAPLGATVTFSDGTPRPPDRFKKKVKEWRRHNGTGLFVAAKVGGRHKYDSPSITLQTLSSTVLVVNQVWHLDTPLTFDVTPPSPGSIIAYSDYGGEREVAHVWPSLLDAKIWAREERYVLGKCGHKYLVVQPDGTLAGTVPE